MQPADAVLEGGQADGHHRQVEHALLGPQGQALLGLAADLVGPRLEVALDQRRLELLVAGRHGRVGGEDGVLGHHLQGRGQALAAGHVLARALEAQEGHVALVHVPDGRADAQGPQGPHAAHAQHDLLAQAHLAPAHVQLPGDGPVGRVVERDVGVEHQHRHAAHLGLPDRGLHHAAGQVDRHGQHAAGERLHRPYRQAREVVDRVEVLLEAVAVDGLPEVARAVEQPHADHRHAQVAGGLAVVAREHAQAARVDAQRLVQPELHREVAHRPLEVVAALGEPAALGVVVVEGRDGQVAGAAELGVGEQALPVGRVDVDEQLDRVVVAAPVVGVDPGEQAAGRGQPAPDQVVGQLAQAFQSGGQLDVGDLQRADLHPSRSFREPSARPPGGRAGRGGGPPMRRWRHQSGSSAST